MPDTHVLRHAYPTDQRLPIWVDPRKRTMKTLVFYRECGSDALELPRVVWWNLIGPRPVLTAETVARLEVDELPRPQPPAITRDWVQPGVPVCDASTPLVAVTAPAGCGHCLGCDQGDCGEVDP